MMLHEKAVPWQDKLASVHAALWRRQQLLYLGFWISSSIINLFILQISKLTDTDMPFLIDENPI